LATAVSPLRCAPAEMTKGSGVMDRSSRSGIGNRRSLHPAPRLVQQGGFISLEVPPAAGT
jgi:hypothetical protein